ncbi:hypothetical protein CY35_08G016800 [Sphagnum magellanicum]|nr:hypothetical protein CY35_08G016800 [Sphagnum magellanicum]KAH9553545.1 hypothetical protein CY35_08G016800 [Sphagnum magellanicum]KAH9553546.1 hypothetical protein CY35_08G016800 [Sphagnum magellanicum]KAH9553547.1 hypothetical protein CY35_08G016800 [Sphagnum magellanicum]KAH9553548.1 hypothetical protein CY35_08G016800 [Sphagnum magellanicum]
MQQCFLIDPRKVNKLLQSLDTCWPTGEGCNVIGSGTLLQQLQESIWSALVPLADSHTESHDASWGLLVLLLDTSSGKAWVLHALFHHTVNMARSGVVEQKFFPSSLHLLKQETFRRYELATLLTLC